MTDHVSHKDSIARIGASAMKMLHSPIRNYIAPGLTSSLVGGDGHGCVRMFTADRDTNEFIVPHSHRFAFSCLVLQGRVENTIFKRAHHFDVAGANLFALGQLERDPANKFGEYAFIPGNHGLPFTQETFVYEQGEAYLMKAEQIHSIKFTRKSIVLFFEEPETMGGSYVLEPWSEGRRVPTFETRPWMFQREVKEV